MALQLKDPSKTYELTHSSGAIFTMKHWTLAMQEIVDRECLEQDGKGSYKWNVTKERALKIDLCVQDWSGIEQEGNVFPCTDENKKLLPVGVLIWLVKDVDERAGLRITEAEKKS